MNSEEKFFATVRTALGQAADGERPAKLFPQLFASPDPRPALARIAARGPAELAELAETLLAAATENRITTYQVSSLAEAEAVVVELVRQTDPEFSHTRHLLCHDHPDIAGLRLWQRFSRESVAVHTSFSQDQQLREKTIAACIGITAPEIAIAETATLVEISGPGRPRSTSLVPSIHVALLRSEKLVADLEEAYALLGQRQQLDSFVFVTGPSKTADIEATLVHGAHGPCELHIILLSEPTLPGDTAHSAQPAESAKQREDTPESTAPPEAG